MEFQGLQNSVPILVIVLCLVIILLISRLTYRKYSAIPRHYKALLTTLRASALIILFLLFLNPFFRQQNEKQVLPKIAVFLDDSESTSIKKGDYDGAASYKNALNAFMRSKPDGVTADYFSFSNSVQVSHPDSLSFDKGATNLDELVQHIINGEGYEGAVVFTDGIITSGKNPIIAAGTSPVPIYTVALGDTNRVRDISIRNVVTNSTGFTHSLHPIKAEITQFGYDDSEITIRLEKDGTVLQSRSLNFAKGQQVAEAEFEPELSNPGLQLFKIFVEPVVGEWNTDNNETNFTIEVLEGKTRITHIASTVHPDVKALKSILSEDESMDIKTYTYLGKWVPQVNWDEAINTGDLIILQGTPPDEFIGSYLSKLAGRPILFMNLPPFFDARNGISALALIQADSYQAVDASILIPAGAKNHPILEVPEIDLTRTAPAFTPVRSHPIQAGAEVLLNANIRGMNTDIALLAVQEIGNLRRSTLNMYGWYKMYLSNADSEREFITALIGNLVDWTATSPDTRLLKVRSSKNSYSVTENPVINASLINENGNNEANAILELTLRNNDEKAENYIFKNLGNGLYRLELPELQPGQYHYEVTAQRDSRLLDTRNGTFIVTESSIELANTIRNDELLKGIAELSSGNYYLYSDAGSIWKDLEASQLLEKQTISEETYTFPVRNVFWFILILGILSAEWMLRKKFSLP